MTTHPIDELDPSYKEKCLQLLLTIKNAKNNENVTHINTRSADNLLTLFGQDNQQSDYKSLPENIVQAKMCYFIWMKQGKANIDPTATGRKVKKMFLLMKDQEENKGEEPSDK